MDVSSSPSTAASVTSVGSASPAVAVPSPTARSQPLQQQHHHQQQQAVAASQALVVVSSSGTIPLVNSLSGGNGNTVVLSAQSAMSATTAQLMTQSGGVAQNSIRLQQHQQPQQQPLIMAPMNPILYSNYLQSAHPVLTHGGNQYIIQNLPALSNQANFQLLQQQPPLPPHSSPLTQITGRRSTVTNAQNIQPRPQQSQLLPAGMGQQIFRTNMSPQLIAQSGGVTPANIQPRPQQSFSRLLVNSSTSQLFAPQAFQQVFSPSQSAGLCWTGQPAGNSGYILRSQNDPIQFLPAQSPLQIPFVQNSVQVPSASAPIAPVTPSAPPVVPQATTQPATSATTTPVRFKPIATRPVASSSSSMATQTAPRTTTSVADTTKNMIRPKVTTGTSHSRPLTSSAAPTKATNGPQAQVREAETSAQRSSPAALPSKPPVMKPDVSSTNAPVPRTADVGPKSDVKQLKGPLTVSTNNTKENKDVISATVKRASEKKDAAVTPNCSVHSDTPMRTIDSPRPRNGVKPPVLDHKKLEAEKTSPAVLIHVIEDFVIEESSKPFPVNGTAGRSVSENGSCRSDGVSIRSESPEEVISAPRLRVPSDAGECQICLKRGPKSRLKLNNGVRACASCIQKKPSAKNGISNPVTSSVSEYDFPGSECHSASKEVIVTAAEPDAVATVSDGRKKVRLAKKVSLTTTTPVSSVQPMDISAPAAVKQPGGESASPGSKVDATPVFQPRSGCDPHKWTVQDVYDFVRHLDGCEDQADEFRTNEIDGDALLLLKEEHLMGNMKMKLGPALKLCSRINALRKEFAAKDA